MLGMSEVKREGIPDEVLLPLVVGLSGVIGGLLTGGVAWLMRDMLGKQLTSEFLWGAGTAAVLGLLVLTITFGLATLRLSEENEKLKKKVGKN